MIKQRRKYRLRLIDAPISLPKELQKSYLKFEEAYTALSQFVHSFYGKLEIDGAVYETINDEDIEYVTSY